MDVTLIYGLITLSLCTWAYSRGTCGVMFIGVTTFVFWLYSALVMNLTEDTTKQAMLAAGDTLQAAIILYTVAYYSLPTIARLIFYFVFSIMLITHTIAILHGTSEGMHYNTTLDAAYALQLLTLGGLMLRDELKRHAPDNSWHLHNPSHINRGSRR